MSSMLGKVIEISHTDSTSSRGTKVRMVTRKHTNGYSLSKMVWEYSERKGKSCWCGVFTLESNHPISAEGV